MKVILFVGNAALTIHEDRSMVVVLLFIPIIQLLADMSVAIMRYESKRALIQNTADRAANMINREDGVIIPEYIDGLEGLVKTVVQTDPDPGFRLTAFTYNDIRASGRRIMVHMDHGATRIFARDPWFYSNLYLASVLANKLSKL